MFRSTRLQAALWGIWSATAWAQEASPVAPGDASAALPAVTTTATRRATAVLTTPATVTLIDQAQLQENLATDFAELFRYEPGVAVTREARGRGGDAAIEVRGIGAQRLGLFLDGVRQPGGYAAAGAATGQLRVDPLSLRRVEVLKGPASSLYGSDALAGVVLLRTLSPQDFLDESARVGGAASAGYDGRDRARWAHADVALRAGPSQNLLSVTARDGHQLHNHDDSALHPNPQQTQLRNVLFKSVLDIDPRQSLTLTGEHWEQGIRTEQRSLVGPIAGGTRITASTADDTARRDRLGLTYRYTPTGAWFDTFTAQLDRQRSASDERTHEARRPPGTGPAMVRDAILSYRDPQWTAGLQLDGHAAAAGVMHRWVAGVDFVSRETSLYNDALQQTAAGTGATRVIDGEVYPRRTAPQTDVRNIGVFVQNEMAFGDGRLRLTPSLRFDTYRITPNPDALFARANVARVTPVELSKSAWTPRLGIAYEWRPRQAVYANLVTGFRMPTPEQLNRSGQSPVATFIHDFIPNPNLKPERSHGVEAGARGSSELGSYEVAAFYNRYSDFIATEMVAYIPPGTGSGMSGGPRAIRRFQSTNLGEVEIYGLEAKGQLALGPLLGSADQWRLVGAQQWTVGNDRRAHQPLNSIQPARLVAGLRWDAGSARGARMGAQLTGNFVAGKRRVNEALAATGATAPVPLRTGGYATADLTAYWRIGRQAMLNFAVYNLFDRRYYDWSTVSGLTGNDARLAAWTAPGRSASVSLRVDF